MRLRGYRKRIVSGFMILAIMVSVFLNSDLEVQAAKMSLSVSNQSVNIGDTVTVTMRITDRTYARLSATVSDGSVLSFVGAGNKETSSEGNGVIFTVREFDASGNATVSLKYKALAAGTAKVVVNCLDAVDAEENDITLPAQGVTVNVENKASEPTPENHGDDNQTVASGDTSLANLSLSAGKLSPSFSAKTLNYTAKVANDVTKIAVSAKPNHAGATVQSVSGNENLQVGENTIKIVVKAENGVTATYKVVVTRVKEGESVEEDAPAPTESEDPSTPAKEFKSGGNTWIPSDVLPEEQTLKDFKETKVMLGGKEYPALAFEKANLTVIFLLDKSNPEQRGLFFVYDAENDTVYPLIRLESGENYVIPLLPEESLIPEGYVETSILIDGKGEMTAYQKKPAAEAVKDTETSWNPFAPEVVHAAGVEEKDFYLIYCVNNFGEYGWYQYDEKEGTYQRYLGALASEDEMLALNEKNTKLQQEFDKLKKTNRIFLVAMIVGTVIFIIIIINLILSRRERNLYGDEDEDEEEMEEDEVDTELENPIDAASIWGGDEDEDDEVEVEFYEISHDTMGDEEAADDIVGELSDEKSTIVAERDKEMENLLAELNIESEQEEVSEAQTELEEEQPKSEPEKEDVKEEVTFATADLPELDEKLLAEAMSDIVEANKESLTEALVDDDDDFEFLDL